MELRDDRDEEGVSARVVDEKGTDGVTVWKELVKRGIWAAAVSRSAACDGETLDGLYAAKSKAG